MNRENPMVKRTMNGRKLIEMCAHEKRMDLNEDYNINNGNNMKWARASALQENTKIYEAIRA